MCLYNDSSSENCNLLKSRVGPFALPERRNIHACEIKFKRKQSKSTGANIEFLQRYSNLNQKQRNVFGHQGTDMIKTCLFNWTPCKLVLESWLSFRYGNCFTFKAKEESSFQRSVGTGGGLELILDVKPNEYVPISHTVGMRIVIHNRKDIPDPETNGINVFPGYETHVSLSQVIIKRLPAPYKDECISYADNQGRFMESQTRCMQACIQEYNYRQCGCVEPSFPAMVGLTKCDVTNSSLLCCLDKVLNNLAVYGHNCKCPLPCLTTYYNKRQTMAKWPSKSSFLQKKHSLTAEDIKFYRNSHAKVKIFFSTLERIAYVQKPVFLESEVYSHLGGELGLWLGLSITAIFEFIEALLYLLWGKITVLLR
ncbi:acid-sensing ion channel 4-B [Caerostris darwini]|uniref:Acid-sensing ion channel 4-B n=1 Tax=Caerostris darwini TaxID=1538125 RepID=A0AAV4VAC8_9ARAC|nr:acid-sensing ion channel 4-B [Caerostris darwini]